MTFLFFFFPISSRGKITSANLLPQSVDLHDWECCTVHWCSCCFIRSPVSIKSAKEAVPISSLGRGGVPYAEALSSLQWTRVWVPAWGPLLRVTPPLSLNLFPVMSSAVLSKRPKKKKKEKRKSAKVNTYFYLCFCSLMDIKQNTSKWWHPSLFSLYSHWIKSQACEKHLSYAALCLLASQNLGHHLDIRNTGARDKNAVQSHIKWGLFRRKQYILVLVRW